MGSTTTSASPRSRSTAPLARIARVVYLIACNTLLAALALEIGFRVFHTRPESEDAYTAQAVPYTLHPYFQTMYIPDAVTDSGPHLAGWRIEPPDGAGPEHTRILFLGGSTTATVYPSFVRYRLEEEHGPTAIYNLAFDWHCSLHALYKFWTYADHIQPDLVVVLENINDFYRGFTQPIASLPRYRHDYSHYAGGWYPFLEDGKSRYDGRPVFYARPAAGHARHEAHDESFGGLWKSLSLHSSFLRFVLARLDPPVHPPNETVAMPPEVYLRALPDFERNMRALVDGCKAKGVPILFLTMPFSTQGVRTFLQPGGFFSNDGSHHLRAEDFESGMRAFNAAVTKLADPPHAHVFDLASSIVEPAQFVDEVHLTESALEEEGRLVAGYILDKGLLPPAAASQR